MPTTKTILIKDLSLDLRNFRTTPQKSETCAIRALISANPEWFWALAESLLEDGYHITENILVLETTGARGKLIVKEGNRRIAALKLCFGYARRASVPIPSNILERIATTSADWKTANRQVPCAVYSRTELAAVDKIVTLTHGKGEKAGRDKWGAVARARHNRDVNGGNEPTLDLLENYLQHGTNLTAQQKERWGADYPLSVLEEALKRLVPRFCAASLRELVSSYPKKIKARNGIEDILSDIGLQSVTFTDLRDKTKDVLAKYGFPDTPTSHSAGTSSTAGKAGTGGATAGRAAGRTTGTATTAAAAASKTKAVATDDPRSVSRHLAQFTPVGLGREKVVTLLNEARRLKLHKHPHAFCFILRSMFEISAKAYCDDHVKSGGPLAIKASGEDRHLVDVLRDITVHLTKNSTDKAMTKRLHAAMADMAKANGILSVTSMNQLVHNPKFSVREADISTMFGNIFPLLEAMNA